VGAESSYLTVSFGGSGSAAFDWEKAASHTPSRMIAVFLIVSLLLENLLGLELSGDLQWANC